MAITASAIAESSPVRELLATREHLRADLSDAITIAQKQFLISLAAGDPDWTLMACPHLAEMPALRWKLENLMRLKKLNAEKFKFQSRELRKRFDAS
jgi:hypothetical protein